MDREEAHPADLVLVGRILKAVGLRGGVLVAHFGGDPARFVPGTRLFLDASGSEEVTVSRMREREGNLLLRLEGRADRTAVEGLAGRQLYRRASELPPPPPGEFYHYQLIGLEVVKADGGRLGRITAIWELPGNDIFEVEGPEGSWLIPGRKEFVAWVDPQKGEMRLTERNDLLSAQTVQASPAQTPPEQTRRQTGMPPASEESGTRPEGRRDRPRSRARQHRPRGGRETGRPPDGRGARRPRHPEKESGR